jgi:hypothetical protein
MAINRRNFGKVMLGVAGGMLAGARLAAAADPADESAGSEKPKHDCKGQNQCKGQGGCKTGDNGCAGKNSCKGKGGCKVPVDPTHMG